VAVVGTAYLQALRFEPLFARRDPGRRPDDGILVVNNLRDIPTDRAAGKRTLAVMLGRRATAAEYALLLAAAFAVPIVLLFGGYGIVELLPLVSVPLAVPLLRTVRDFREPRELNPVLKGTARLDLAFGVLFAAALALRGWPA
jgi:1,4-dihydroxy-2-naphthoate octaprenyltransferase